MSNEEKLLELSRSIGGLNRTCSNELLKGEKIHFGQPPIFHALLERDEQSQCDIAAAIGVSRASVGVSLRRMEKSGIVSRVINQKDRFLNPGHEDTKENIAASFQRQAVNILMKRVKIALKDTGLKRISAGGGVAANSLLRKELKDLEKSGYTVTFPSLKLCTDNGAMVAGLAYNYFKDGLSSGAEVTASARVSAFKKF